MSNGNGSENLSRIAGSSVRIEMFGRSLKLPAATMKDFGEVENEMLRANMDRAIEVADRIRQRGGPRAKQKADEVMRQANLIHSYSIDKIMNFIGETTKGHAALFWVLLEKNYPGEFTPQEIEVELLEYLRTDPRKYQQLAAALMQISNLDDRGNSPGQAERKRRDQRKRNRPTGE